MKGWYPPLDQDCPVVAEFYERMTAEPYDAASGEVLRVLIGNFSAVHRTICPRCQEYGAAHIEVGEV
jgi:hypothetical protein